MGQAGDVLVGAIDCAIMGGGTLRRCPRATVVERGLAGLGPRRASVRLCRQRKVHV